MATVIKSRVVLRAPHYYQALVRQSRAKRKIVRAGRRSGKTTGAADEAVENFLAGQRVLYATPTGDQIQRFWHEVRASLAEPIEHGLFVKNETLHVIEEPGTERRIRAKTAWNADTLRGDYADKLILDEWQLMDEDAWEVVGAPMLLDNNGDALFIYTPPSLHSRSVSKARDPRHAAKMFKRAQEDTTGRWETFHFTSHDNPFISQEALADITLDMTALAVRQEIMAEDIEDVPGALWTLALIEATRLSKPPSMARIVIGVDPPGGVTECGIIAAGLGTDGHRYVLADYSLRASPERWAEAALALYEDLGADRIVIETNYGGDMARSTIQAAARARGVSVRIEEVHATRGKAIRAEPCVAGYERGEVHHVGSLPLLEEEMISWVPGQPGPSPNRLDALVWALTALEMPRGGRFTRL